MARADIPSEWLCKTCGAIHSPATGLCWKCQEKLFARRHHRFMRYARMMKRRDPRWRAGTGLRGYSPYSTTEAGDKAP